MPRWINMNLIDVEAGALKQRSEIAEQVLSVADQTAN
jgi:hypothetical protein